MTIENGNIPLFFQFYLSIRNEIIRGDLQPGDRIPAIDELVKQYGVSQSSIIKALTLLEEAGFIHKKQRIGIHVCNNPVRVISELSPSLGEEVKKLTTLKRKVISAEWILPPKRVIHYFKKDKNNILKDGKIFLMRRLLTSTKESWRRRLSDLYIPAFLYDKVFLDSELDIVVLEKVLNTDTLGYGMITSIENIHPWNCDVKTARYLRIPNGTPIFQTTIRFYSANEELLWISEAYTTAQTIVRKVQTKGPKKKKQKS